MASHSKSFLHDWLRFDGTTTTLPALNSCTFIGVSNGTFSQSDASCTKVCNDSLSLFEEQTSNLVTCGLWTSLASASSELNADNVWVQSNDSSYEKVLQHFEGVNLTNDTFKYASSYAALISDCMEIIYLNVKENSFSDDGQVPSACTKEQLFPLGSAEDAVQYPTKALGDCIDSICSPLTLNPDLAGIGVSSRNNLYQQIEASDVTLGLLILHDTIGAGYHCSPCPFIFGALLKKTYNQITIYSYR